jgi:hypothetical protein
VDKATLVKSDSDLDALVRVALSRAKIPVTLCVLDYVPQLDEWQLIVATPWYDSRGPHEANAKVISALEDQGFYSEVPIRRVYVRSPQDPIVKSLELELKTQTEGTIHVVASASRNDSKKYSVVFAPYRGSGGAMPARNFSGADQLREFLEKRLRIDRSSVDEALNRLEHSRVASIFHVVLTKREVKNLGLA